MKKLAILLVILTFIGCSKEEKTVIPAPVPTPVIVASILHQEVNGTVITDHSYQIKIYEDMGSGNFQNTITNEYTLNTFPFVYEDEVNRPFYFEVVLHNSSLYSNGGKGILNITIKYKNVDVIFLEADENTWSKIYTSVIYNN